MKRSLPILFGVPAIAWAMNTQAQCPGSFAATLYSTDFEANDGGFVESGGGDWEYGSIPVVITGANCGGTFTSPEGAHSGTKGWGTVLDGCYNNLGAFSGTGFTVDLSDPSLISAQLNFANWFGVFVNFDYLRITANGTEVYRNDNTENSGGWFVQSVDLTPFIGQASLNIVFDLWASTVVNRTGWYIDDVSVDVCASQPLGVAAIGRPGARVWPVPASDVLNIKPSTAGGKVEEWSLFDASGRKLSGGMVANTGEFAIDVSAFQGVCVLDLRTATGHQRQQVVLH